MEGFETIGSPSLNEVIGVIESYERVSAAQYCESRYVWREGKLLLQRMREIEYETDGTIGVIEKTNGEGFERSCRFAYEEWERIAADEKRIEAIAGKIMGEKAHEMFVRFAGEKNIDDETYFVYQIMKEYEMIYLFYAACDDSERMLFDEVMDGVTDPQWELTEDGTKNKR